MTKEQKSSNKVEVHFKIYLTDFIKGVKKLWWVCIVLALVFGGGYSAKGVMAYKPQYTASATFVVSLQSVSGANTGLTQYSYVYDTTTAEQLASTFPHILGSNLLQEVVCTQLGVESMPASVSATTVAGTNMFKLTTVGKDPQKTYDTLLSVIDNYPSVAKHVIGNIKMDMITAPVFPEKPSNSKGIKDDFTTGSLFGLLVGVILIFLYAVFRNTIRTKEEIVTELNNKVLGAIPRTAIKKRGRETDTGLLISNPRITSVYTEAIRVLRNVFVNNLNEDEKVVLVTSTAPGEGKTTVTTNLAISLAKRKKRVLLVEGDLRNPSVAPLLGIEWDELNYESVSDEYRIAYVEQFNIRILQFVVPEDKKAKSISTAQARKVFEKLRDGFDYILVDTPPCGLVSDAMFIAQAADAAVYVVHQDVVRVSKIKSAINNLHSTDVRVLGCVLNGTIGSTGGYTYGSNSYDYGYGYKKGYGSKKTGQMYAKKTESNIEIEE